MGDILRAMDPESVSLDDLNTADLINGPVITHMRQIFNLLARMSVPVATGKPVDVEQFGELQITIANLFRDISVLTMRFGLALVKGYLE